MDFMKEGDFLYSYEYETLEELEMLLREDD